MVHVRHAILNMVRRLTCYAVVPRAIRGERVNLRALAAICEFH